MENELFNTNGESSAPEIVTEGTYDKKVAYVFTFDEVTLRFMFSLS